MTDNKLVGTMEPLATITGWASLSQTKKDKITEITDHIKEFHGAEALAAANAGLELLRIEQLLEGERMTMTDYLDTMYAASPSTGRRRLAAIKEWTRHWPVEVIKRVAERGPLLLRGCAGLGLADFLQVARELPPPRESTPERVDSFIEHAVRDKLKENRQGRSHGKPLKLRREDSARLSFNKLRGYMRNTRNLNTSAARTEYLEEIIGWIMEDFAIPGPMKCTRRAIPPNTIAQVGRPRKPPTEKAA